MMTSNHFTDQGDNDTTTNTRSVQIGSVQVPRKGRYMSRGPDRHPPIPPSQVLLFQRQRPGRLVTRRTGDQTAATTYGDAIVYKNPESTRFMFQNVKGLTYTMSGEDYQYFLSAMSSYSVDVYGMAETNSGWQHSHLQANFKQCVRRQFQYGKTVFGSVSAEIDPISSKETFQAGGVLQVARGPLTTSVFGPPITDPSGLGRWCGFTLIGKDSQKFSIITGYRTCSGSITSAPLGSTFHREYVYFQEQGEQNPQPRAKFVSDLAISIRTLREEGHAILVMMDANAVLSKDGKLREMLMSHDLSDLHQKSHAPSTYIGSDNRRIDYMFGCPRTATSVDRQGTLSYFEGPQSDHRALYIDINISQLLGVRINEHRLPSLSRRALRSGHPELTATYHREMRVYYEAHNMKARIESLFEKHQTMSRNKVRQLLTSWDDDQGRAMQRAENSLRVKPKLYQWSPRLRNAGVVMRYWKLRLRELKGDEDYSRTFERWERQIQKFDPAFELPDRLTVLPIATVRSNLNKATKTLRKTQKEASELHNANYEELLESYELDDNPDTQHESKRKAKIIKRTIMGESSRQLFGKIRQIVKPTEYTALTQILVPRSLDSLEPTKPGQVHDILQSTPSENLIWDTVITREDIETHLLHFNREAFRAASESPCGNGLIHDALSFTSLTPEAEALLLGEIPAEWHGDRILLREFLASFKIPDSVLTSEPISQTITSDDIVRGFRSWKETTTTSPSGRHLGRYKAMIQDPMLLECLRKFMNIAISRGISVPRWSNAVNVMIEKDKGSPKINRLRIIHLFEADYNLFLKIMWGSRLVKRTVQLNLLNDGQHGSVPGRTTMDPVMLNQLTTDLCRLLKINYARFDNDASACFDRIIVALGMLAARRCGMPTESIRTHAKSLELMKYMVKTVYGVSEDFYCGTPLEPLFGTGQGSGASPAVWLSLVVLLLNTLERVTPDCISFRSVDGSLTHHRLVDAFVDDTAIGITDNGSKSLPELVSALETVAQTWEQLLHFSGGALNLQKCSWYVMYWDWRQGRPLLRTRSDNDPTIRLYQGSSSKHTCTIRRQGTTEPTRILGVHQTPSGDFSAHIKVLKDKADTYAGFLKSPRLTPSDVRVFHKTIYDPAMRYSLPAIATDEEELDKVQSKIIPAIVQKLGFSSKLPTAIRFGPVSMGGLGLVDLRTEVGIEMIKYFRHEVHSNTEVGRLFLLQLQASQLEAGLPIQLLEDPRLHIPYLTPTWILSMRQFMSNHNISITITDTLKFPLKSKTDQYIMDTTRLKGYTSRQQQDLNLMRLFLQVVTISDMVDRGEPSKIAEWALKGERPLDFVLLPTWPRQQSPSTRQQRLWKRYISSQFLRYDRTWRVSPSMKLRDILQESKTTTETTNQDKSVSTMIKRLPRNKKRLLAHFKLVTTEDNLWAECQRKQTLTIASDGGLKGRQGTFGWSLSTSSNKLLCEGAGPVDGPFDTANSTRCELGGYAAALLLLSLLHSSWGKRHNCNFRWVTDSKTALKNVVKHTKRHKVAKQKQPSNPDYMSIISTETKNLRRNITAVWVKGHQHEERTESNRVKGYDVIRNNHVDSLATWYREQRNKRQSKEQTEHTPEAIITISLNGVRLVSQVEQCLRHHINGYQLRMYVQSKNRWSNSLWDCIDVEVFGRFFTKISTTSQAAQTKYIHDQWHTGIVRYRNAATKDPILKICPCCKTVEETTNHVIRCQHNVEHANSLKTFRSTMSPKEPHPVFQIIKEGVISWIESAEFHTPSLETFPTKFHETIKQAIQDQNAIGWDNALKGYLSIRWRLMAEESMYGHGPGRPEKGFQSILTIIKALHVLTQTKWKARNKTLHDNTEAIHKHIREAELVEIRELYNRPEHLRVGDRHYCEQPLNVILQKTPSSRRRWLRCVRLSKARALKDNKRQTLLTDFFRTTIADVTVLEGTAL